MTAPSNTGHWLPVRCLAAAGVVVATLSSSSTASAQTPTRLLVTVMDEAGAPVAGLTRDEFTVRLDDVELDLAGVEPAPTTVQVVAIFEGLAVTQQQLTSALSQFIESLDDESIVDMQSVDGTLDAAIVEAVDDLHARRASRPVIVMIGQATEIVPSELQSSQVRGKRQAADLSGDLDQLGRLQAEHGILFYGVSVTEVSLANFRTLAAGTGGRFEVITAPTELSDTLTAIGRELVGPRVAVDWISWKRAVVAALPAVGACGGGRVSERNSGYTGRAGARTRPKHGDPCARYLRLRRRLRRRKRGRGHGERQTGGTWRRRSAGAPPPGRPGASQAGTRQAGLPAQGAQGRAPASGEEDAPRGAPPRSANW